MGNREDARNWLTASSYPTEALEIPEWGGALYIVRGISLGDDRFTGFVDKPIRVEDSEPLDLSEIERLPAGSTKAEKTAARVARQVLGDVMRKRWEPPSEAEQSQRRILAGAIMGLVDDDGEQVFTFDDATDLRRNHWNVCVRVAGKVFELSAPVDLEEAKNS